MKTLTINIKNAGEQAILEETLKNLGVEYSLESSEDRVFTEAEIASFVKNRKDFIEGKTTARNWDDIEKDLNRAYN